MLLQYLVASMFAAAMLVLATGVASGQATSTGSAQAYPTKPVRFVTAGVGSGSDLTSRFIAQGISGPLGQQVIVENRPSGVIPGQVVSQAPPDGYTLLVTGASHWIGTLIRRTSPYDAVKDFAPVTAAITEPSVLVVHSSVPAKSVRELIALAKARPGELNWAFASLGSASHLAAELFKFMAGVKIQGVHYPTTSVRITELLSGQTQLTMDGVQTVLMYVKSGKLRALAVTTLERTALAPGLPTVAESGLPGYEAIGTTAVYAPAKTPDLIITRLNQEIVRFLNLPDSKARMLVMGVDVVASTPAELTARVNIERDQMGKVIKAAGIQTD